VQPAPRSRPARSHNLSNLRYESGISPQQNFPSGVYPCHGYNPTMKRAELSLVALWAGLVLGTSAPAATDTISNPYAGIVERNLFNLKPAPRPEDAPKPPGPPPPKIELTGIMTIFGKRQVLMKVNQPPHPPEPGKIESYVLSEGESEGEVEVVSIDQSTGTVKLNNHGVEQILNLDKDSAKVTGAPAGAGGVSPTLPLFQPPQMPRLPSSPDSGTFPRSIPLPTRPMRLPGGGMIPGGAQSQSNPTLPEGLSTAFAGLGGSGGAPQIQKPLAAPAQPELTAEEQEILLAAQHLKAVENNDPVAPLIPLTPRAMKELYPNGQGQPGGTSPAPGQP